MEVQKNDQISHYLNIVHMYIDTVRRLIIWRI